MGATLPRRIIETLPNRRPDPDRLQAAVDFIVARLNPDQLILYGSAARGHMTPDSDLDFLAVNAAAHTPSSSSNQFHWDCDATGDAVDVLVVDRERLEERRWIAGTVHAAALTEGRTVFSRDEIQPIQTIAESPQMEFTMIAKSRFAAQKATEFISKARKRLKIAQFAYGENDPHSACEDLQTSAEHALKALIIANRTEVIHTHNLNDLWTQAEDLGEQIEAERDVQQLDKMTMYAGKWRYDQPESENPGTSYLTFRPVAEDILNYAERRVPILEQAENLTPEDFALTTDDPDHSSEEAPFLTTGYSDRHRLLVVAHTDRDDRVRVISAREVTASEQHVYREEPE